MLKKIKDDLKHNDFKTRLFKSNQFFSVICKAPCTLMLNSLRPIHSSSSSNSFSMQGICGQQYYRRVGNHTRLVAKCGERLKAIMKF